MNALKLILLFCLLQDAFSKSKTLTFKEIKKEQGQKQRKLKSKRNIKKVSKSEFERTKKLLEAYRYRASLQQNNPIILTKNIINEADFIGARTTQAILATNTKGMTVLSHLEGADLPEGTKILCDVYTKYKRICGDCTRIIINGKGHDIQASLHNKDGSNCVIGQVSDDKEKYLTGIFLSEMAKGAIALSRSSIPTIGGNLIRNNARNKIGQGLINTAGEVTELMKEEYQTSEPIVTYPANSKVIVQFRKGFSL
jgi:hypothetical protein